MQNNLHYRNLIVATFLHENIPSALLSLNFDQFSDVSKKIKQKLTEKKTDLLNSIDITTKNTQSILQKLTKID